MTAETVSLRTRLAFWCLLAVAILFVLWLLRDILLPFVAGLGLAYLLNPIANRLDRLGVSRMLAAVLILLLALLVVLLALVLLVPLLGNQLFAFLRALPYYLDQLQGFLTSRLAELGDNPIARHLSERLRGGDQPDTGSLIAQVAAWTAAVAGSLLSGGQALASVLGLLLVTPIVALYILVDWPRMIATVDGWLPRDSAETLRALAREVDRTIAAFIRGQALVCLVLALFYGIALTATGLNFGLLIGMSAGLLSFIPYAGSAIGFVTAMGVALVQFWPNGVLLAVIAGIFVVGQIIDGYVLQPKFVGTSVGLHPVWLMFALFAFGSLLGFVGLLLAVPLAASIGVLLRFALKRYQTSAFYVGPPAAPSIGPESEA